MSDTPRTDWIAERNYNRQQVPAEFARELERELAEIKAFAPAVGQAVDYLAMKGPDTMRDDCMGRLEVLEYKLRKSESALPNAQAQSRPAQKTNKL